MLSSFLVRSVRDPARIFISPEERMISGALLRAQVHVGAANVAQVSTVCNNRPIVASPPYWTPTGSSTTEDGTMETLIYCIPFVMDTVPRSWFVRRSKHRWRDRARRDQTSVTHDCAMRSTPIRPTCQEDLRRDVPRYFPPKASCSLLPSA